MRATPKNLSRVISVSRDQNKRWQRSRVMFMRQAGGRFYSRLGRESSEESKASPINLMSTAVNTLVPNLIQNNPRVKLRSRILAFRRYAELLELATNHAIKELRLERELRKVVTDSIYGAGFMKTGLATSEVVVTIDGIDVEIGQPFAERVDPDDIILDPLARDWDEQTVYGHRIRTTRDDLMRLGVDKTAVMKLSSRYEDNLVTRHEAANIMRGNPDRVRDLAKTVHDYVDVAELYIPQENRMVILPYAPDMIHTEFLHEFEWAGPETGPLHMLGYTFMGDNVLPVHPAGLWFDLHLLSNRIARKIGRQADRSKRITIYTGNATEDAIEIAEASDGDMKQVNDVDAVKELQYGGVSEDSYTYMQWLKQQFSEQTGNLDVLAGQGTDVPTLGQSEILQANASVRLADMELQVHKFTTQIISDIAFQLHTDPLIELPLIKRRRGIDQQVVFSADDREGDFLDYEITLEPFSMKRQDPDIKVRRMLEAVTTAVPAVAQAQQLLGPGFKGSKMLARIFKELSIDEADEFFDEEEYTNFALEQAANLLAKGKAEAVAAGPPGSPIGPPPTPDLPGGGRPGQPVPSQQGPTGGISPSGETASARQEASAAIQSGRQVSTRTRAQARL